MPWSGGHPAVNFPAIYLGLIIATSLASLYHFLRGGPIGRLILYVITAWITFFLGHLVAEALNWELIRLGSLNLFPAALATVLGLLFTDILAGNRQTHSRRKPKSGSIQRRRDREG